MAKFTERQRPRGELPASMRKALGWVVARTQGIAVVAGVGNRRRRARARRAARRLRRQQLDLLRTIVTSPDRRGPQSPNSRERRRQRRAARETILAARALSSPLSPAEAMREAGREMADGIARALAALVRCALFADRSLDAGTIGVIPIMSASRDEADGRFVTIRATLRACGLVPSKEDEDRDVPYLVAPGGLDGTYQTKRSQAGGGVIATKDARGHRIEFRILPALVRHGIGWTGGAGFADESDLWPDDPEHHVNPASVILDRVSERFTTQPSAEFFVFSASYKADSAFRKLIEDPKEGGDTPLQHIARLGTIGAQMDFDARRDLAAVHGLDDPRLQAPGDPLSPDLPAWVFNSRLAPIGTCYQTAKHNLSRMLALYGGRAAENTVASMSGGAAWCDGLADRNAKLADAARQRSPSRVLGAVESRWPGERRRLPPMRRRTI